MKNFSFASCLLLVALAGSLRADEAPPAPEFQQPEFQQVAAIFEKYCNACHSGEEPEGGLALDSFDAVLQGGESGAVLTPGAGQESRLVGVLVGTDDLIMPPDDAEPPNKDEIALLRAWIDAGAKGPVGPAPDPEVLNIPQVELTVTPRASLHAAAFSPDGALIALGGYRQVRVVLAAGHAEVLTLGPHDGAVNSVSFTADGARLIAAAGEPGRFGQVKIWNLADGSLERTLRGHADCLYDAVLAADGRTLATAGYDGQIKLWDLSTGEELRTLKGHNGAIFDLDFSPDGGLLASASADRTVKLWNVSAGQRVDTFSQPLLDLYAVCFSPDGARLAAGGMDNRIRVWSIGPGGQEGTNELLISRFAHEGAIIELAYAPDGKSLVSTAEDATAKIWHAATIDERALLEPQSDWPVALAVDPTSTTVVVGRLDGAFARYNLTDGEPTAPAAAKPELADVQPSRIWRGESTRIKLTGQHLAGVTSLEVSDGKLAYRILPEGQIAGKEAWIELSPAADLAEGPLELAVKTAGGASARQKLIVLDKPDLEEAEPNDLAGEQVLGELPVRVGGVFDRKGDVDYFTFQASAGETIVFDTAAARLGSRANPVLTVFDADGRVAASNNDFDDEPDPLLAYVIPRDGRYGVSLRDLLADGSPDHFYTLSVGPLRYVTGCYPLGVPPNATTEVQLVGYNIPPGETVSVTAGERGEAVVRIDRERFHARRELKVVVGQPGESLEVEPNDMTGQASSLSAPGVVNGRIAAGATDGAADVDLFRFESAAGRQWIIETESARRGAPLDAKIEVLDADGAPVERLRLQAVRDSYIDFRAIDSNIAGVRLKNWEEMELNQYVYLGGEVARIFRMPQGPDSDLLFYTLRGKRRCYFGTSAASHANLEPAYVVEPRAPDETIAPNGLPVFPLYYANDDDGERRLGRDATLHFTAPAAGAYQVRVTDVRGMGGDRYAYRLIVRPPRPDFHLSVSGLNAPIVPGGGRGFRVAVDRRDGFDGDVKMEVSGLPPGFHVSTPLVVQAGHVDAHGVLHAAADAPSPSDEAASKATVIATAVINGETVVKPAVPLGKIRLAGESKILVRLEPDQPRESAGDEPWELAIAPGATVTARLRVERNGFEGRIPLTVENLPHGVIVDNIGLNGVLINEDETERQIFLTAAKWVPAARRPFYAVANVEGNQASPPAMLRVQGPGDLAVGTQSTPPRESAAASAPQ